MYEYLGDTERDATLKSRKEKEILPIGKGGEGFIGEDYWCYNCGGEGHLGDVSHNHQLHCLFSYYSFKSGLQCDASSS